MIRNRYIDFLKGIAIFLMIFAHAMQYGSGDRFFFEEMYWENIIFKTIYSFHMPLFMSVSGYLFYFSVKKHTRIIGAIKHRLSFLIPVCFSWAFILLGKDLLISGFNKESLLKTLFVYFITDFWFLWSIVASICCVGIIYIIKSKFDIGGAYLAVFILFFLTPDKFWLSAHKFMIPFFVFGGYIAKYRNYLRYRKVIFPIAFLLWVILLNFYSRNIYIYTTGFTILGKSDIIVQLIIDFYRYAIGIVGVISVACIMYWSYEYVENSKLHSALCLYKLIEYIGKNSIRYYVLSTYIFIWIVPDITNSLTSNYLINFLEAVVVCLICEVFSYVILKSRMISRLLIGR